MYRSWNMGNSYFLKGKKMFYHEDKKEQMPEKAVERWHALTPAGN